jgi:hypothetical protein
MENTKATIPTKALVYGFAVLGVLLAVAAVFNLFSTYTPIADLNASMDTQIKAITDLPADQKHVQFDRLRALQEKALAKKPSEPYGWARLSYLRTVLGDDAKDAFAALRMSDLVSPYEVQQLPERAVAWVNFHAVENKDEKDYQDTLWQKAFTVAPDATWTIALSFNMTKAVGEAIARKDPGLAEGWHGRMADAGMPY